MKKMDVNVFMLMYVNVILVHILHVDLVEPVANDYFNTPGEVSALLPKNFWRESTFLQSKVMLPGLMLSYKSSRLRSRDFPVKCVADYFKMLVICSSKRMLSFLIMPLLQASLRIAVRKMQLILINLLI